MAKGKYEEWLEADNLLRLQAWARDGLTDEQIANNVGITPKTLYNWKQNHLPILQALKKGKEVVDIEVENALHMAALGFTGPDGKYYPPDTTALIFWLKNRKPDEWRDKKETELSGGLDVRDNPYDELTAEELRKLIDSG